ncbi:MAG: hypothetical protein K0R83_2250 [Caulobacter sp.]|nr:hypothetical protein [Caulobacter sp.]
MASAGDVNGDGVDDVIVGAKGADTTYRDSGAAYVVFGRADGVFPADLNLSALDGSFVVFGRDTATDGAFAADLDLADLDGSNGFRISGSGSGVGKSGWSVASAGDVNGDGVDDLIIGVDAWHGSPGAAYVVFGKDTAADGAFAADLEITGLDGTTGFRLTGVTDGDDAGWSVASAGDVNGDGIADMIVGAPWADPNGNASGASYVVFGRDTATAGGFAASLSLGALNGTNGFRIVGAASDDRSGVSVASAGDVNGDGVDDLIVGAMYADTGGSGSGTSYVVFGRNTAAAGAFAANLNLATLDGTNGFRLDGGAPYDISGFSVAAAGDVNGDGLDDLIIGAKYAATANGPRSGASYVVFGQRNEVKFVGAAGNDTRSGGFANDTLSGLGGNDVLYGLGGDDALDGGDLSDLLYGGGGADDLVGGGGGDILNGDEGADQLTGNDGADKLVGGDGADQLFGGNGNDRMGGEADIDTLEGGSGNDLLDGGLGADIMSGGSENDVYVVDHLGDQTIELAGEGYDLVRSFVDGWVLAANVEALELQGTGDLDGTGNGEANNLQGNGGANVLSGLAGVDTINGNDGDDVIIGGQNSDLLRGGLGADTFRVEHAFSGALETDQIYDFSTAEGDRMDFSGAYAGTIARVASFTHHAGEMTLTFAAGSTTVRLDIDGNGTAEYQVRINGDVTGDWGGWAL